MFNFIRNRSPVHEIINSDETQEMCQIRSILAKVAIDLLTWPIIYLNYFNGPGKVSWQQDAIEKRNFKNLIIICIK